jgi:hypothetical protein
MYIWDCERPPIRPSVSPLPSFAARPLKPREESTKSRWVRRAALRLYATKDVTPAKKPE